MPFRIHYSLLLLGSLHSVGLRAAATAIGPPFILHEFFHESPLHPPLPGFFPARVSAQQAVR